MDTLSNRGSFLARSGNTFSAEQRIIETGNRAWNRDSGNDKVQRLCWQLCKTLYLFVHICSEWKAKYQIK